MSVKKPDIPMLPPKVNAKNEITLQVKRTFSGKAYIRVVPNLEWLKCSNDLTGVILLDAQRVLQFEGVGRLTNCWELELKASAKKGNSLRILDYAKKVEPFFTYAYLYEAIHFAESTVKRKRAESLTSTGTTYPTYKERGNV